jgi:hypothetical protein
MISYEINPENTAEVRLIFTWSTLDISTICSAGSIPADDNGALVQLKVQIYDSEGNVGPEISIYDASSATGVNNNNPCGNGGSLAIDDLEYSGNDSYVTSYSMDYAGVINSQYIDFCRNGVGTTARSCKVPNSSFILPISLESFKALETGNGNEIIWNVLDDGTQHSFLIEKSIDGVNFNHLETIEEKESAGNDFVKYSILDRQPFQSTYYRLIILQESGKETYSEIVQVQSKSNFSVKKFSVFPNPSHGKVNVKYVSEKKEDSSYEIYNSIGELVNKGQQKIEIGSNHFSLNLNDVFSGPHVFLLKMHVSGEVLTRKVLKY